jgi:hypothetical protein
MDSPYPDHHGRTGRKKLGGGNKFARLFRILPDQCQKIFREKINFDDPPPPSRKKFRSVYHFRGPKNFRTYQNFSKHHTNFPDIINFPKKRTEFVPFFLIISQYCPTVERILPDWLCLPNKLGGLAPPHPAPPARYAHADHAIGVQNTYGQSLTWPKALNPYGKSLTWTWGVNPHGQSLHLDIMYYIYCDSSLWAWFRGVGSLQNVGGGLGFVGHFSNKKGI